MHLEESSNWRKVILHYRQGLHFGATKICLEHHMQIRFLVNFFYCTANFYPMKTTGNGNCRVPAGKICTINGKGMQELWGNPMIITGPIIITGFVPNYYSLFSIDSADFPCRDPAISSPRSFHGVKICNVHCEIFLKMIYWDFQSSDWPNVWFSQTVRPNFYCLVQPKWQNLFLY